MQNSSQLTQKHLGVGRSSMRSKYSWARSQKTESFCRLYENSIGQNPFCLSPFDGRLLDHTIDTADINIQLNSVKKSPNSTYDRKLLQDMADYSDMFGNMTSEKKIELKGLFTPNFAKDKIIREQYHQVKDPISSFDDFSPILAKRPPKPDSKGSSKTRQNHTNKNKSGCTCPRSQCTNHYCDCVKAGGTCTKDCSCKGCKNLDNQNQVQPKSKRIRRLGSSASNKCICRKSNCTAKTCKNTLPIKKLNHDRLPERIGSDNIKGGTMGRVSTTDNDTLYCNSDLSMKVAQDGSSAHTQGPRIVRGKL